MLLNGNIEHDNNVSSIDTHAGLKIIASGDESGLIKIWNFRRQLIREIKFTEPISAVCFLNARADLVVGHKGKLSRILAQDYLPHASAYQYPTEDELCDLLKKYTVKIPDDFFLQLKQQNDEIALQNERFKRRKSLPEEENKALMSHLTNLFKETPKYGMPMDQFKALLAKDDRVPKLLDKSTVMNALQAKLLSEKV